MVTSRKADFLRAISMLGELPAEVGQGFLAPLIQDVGWPFQSAQDSMLGTDWHRILYPLTLQQFTNLNWLRSTFLFDENLFHPKSRDDIGLVIRNLTESVWAAIGRDSEPSRVSFTYHRSRILRTRDFCAPVTLALTPEGMVVLDGNHRVAALLSSGLAQA